MGILRDVAVTVLALSFIVFTALFGRIPAFRKTPIGFLYRVIWIYAPKFFSQLDRIFCGGRFFQYGGRTGHYLMHENHPLVLIFFIALLVICEVIFIPAAWSRLSTGHHIATPIVVIFPYILLYLSATSSSAITAENHSRHMHRYPYDRIIFHPHMVCSTCRRLKPARSKHCSLCNTCVARNDHHCIWLRNCVGQNNYCYFLGLLLSMSILLGYGAYQGYMLLDATLQEVIAPYSPDQIASRHWAEGLPWMVYFEFWGLSLGDDIAIGGVFLLAALTSPLALGMFLYHIYLIWSGMTTNESGKWADWRDDIADGLAFMAKASDVHEILSDYPLAVSDIGWPIKDDRTLVYTNGEAPKAGFAFTNERNSIVQPNNPNALIDRRWVQVQNLDEIVNIYDLGFWGNLRDLLLRR